MSIIFFVCLLGIAIFSYSINFLLLLNRTKLGVMFLCVVFLSLALFMLDSLT